ncbi:hypothetical protein AGMMS49982_05490 [Bacteroidia bacterium]|nr:hypothetical protein AGMMS49982_05490 [Bacteroidia bacterium]
MNTTKKINKRAVVSIALLIIFVLLPVSGIMLAKTRDNPDPEAFAPQLWDALHGAMGLLFIIFGICHIINNWNAIKHYIKG